MYQTMYPTHPVGDAIDVISGNNSTESSGWVLHSCSRLHEAAICCMEYDLKYELLWCGYNDGRVTSYRIDQYQSVALYSSFKLPASVVAIVPLHNSTVVCVSEVSVHIYKYGGMQKSYRKLQDMYNLVTEYDLLVSSSTGSQPQNKSVSDNTNNSATYPTIKSVSVLSDKLSGDSLYTLANKNNMKLALGTSCTSILVVEILSVPTSNSNSNFNHSNGELIKPLVQYDIEPNSMGTTTCSNINRNTTKCKPSSACTSIPLSVTTPTWITAIASSSSHILVATSSGKLYMLDGRMLLKTAHSAASKSMKKRWKKPCALYRNSLNTNANQQPDSLVNQCNNSALVTNTVSCYEKGGYITRLSIDPVDTRTLFYCGLVISNNKFSSDPLVHVMDLRNGMRQLMPVTLPLASPCVVSSSVCPVDRGDGQLVSTGMLLSISTAGAIQCSPLNGGVPDTVNATSLFAPLNSLVQENAPFALGSKAVVRVTSVCMSSSSHFMSVGCSNGYVIQYSNNAPLVYGWAEALQVVTHDQADPVSPQIPSFPTLKIPHHHNAAGLSKGDAVDNAIIYAIKSPHSNPSVPPSYNPNSPDAGVVPEVSYYDPENEAYYDPNVLESMYAYTLPTVREFSEDVANIFYEDLGQRHWCIAQNNFTHHASCEESNKNNKNRPSDSKAKAKLNPPLFLSEFPLSSFASTPFVISMYDASHMMRREVAKELLQQSCLREFIGYARNPGYPYCNSLIQIQELAMARCRWKFGKDFAAGGHKQNVNPNAVPLVGPHLPYQLLDSRLLPDEIAYVESQMEGGKRQSEATAKSVSVGSGDAAPLDPTAVLATGSKSTSSAPVLLGVASGDITTGSLSPAYIKHKNFINDSAVATLGANRMQRVYHQFDYVSHNSLWNEIQFDGNLVAVGLDNTYHYAHTAYLNSLIQMLFSIPAFRNLAMMSQTSSLSTLVCSKTATATVAGTTSLLNEFGYVFHMMCNTFLSREITSESGSGALSDGDYDCAAVTPTRLQQIFGHWDDVMTLGLVPTVPGNNYDDILVGIYDSNPSTHSTAAQANITGVAAMDGIPRGVQTHADSGLAHALDFGRRIQLCIRFCLQQFRKELPLLTNMDPKELQLFEKLFGFSVDIRNHYIKSKHSENAPSIAAYTLELESVSALVASVVNVAKDLTVSSTGFKTPYIKSTKAASSIHISMAHMFFRSLRREIYLKGYCTATRTYDSFRQVRAVRATSLPVCLTVLCGETMLGFVEDGVNSVSLDYLVHDKLCLAKNLEIIYSNRADSLQGQLLYVSCLMLLPDVTESDASTNDNGHKYQWVVYDGSTEVVGSKPASLIHNISTKPNSNGGQVPMHTVITYELYGIISDIKGTVEGHMVAHVRSEDSWVLFNDYYVKRCGHDPNSDLSLIKSERDALWCEGYRRPSVLLYRDTSRWDTVHRNSGLSYAPLDLVQKHKIPVSVLAAPSLSLQKVPLLSTNRLVSYSVPKSKYQSHHNVSALAEDAFIPGEGDLIAFDAEFVSVEKEKFEIDSNTGRRIVQQESRQMLARISLLYGGCEIDDASSPLHGGERVDKDKVHTKEGLKEYIRALVTASQNLLSLNQSSASADLPTPDVAAENTHTHIVVDDYIVPMMPVTDYVTRFSGLIQEDLNPATSNHNLVTSRDAYLKLRCFVDRGCIFVGHGLQKDFEIANIVIHKSQVRDTVNLWRLPNQRKLSLRFLSHTVLQSFIQDEVHDSVEDARTALLLYKVHNYICKFYGQAYMDQLINNIYQHGAMNNWSTVARAEEIDQLFDTVFP